jgi:4-amino-4-deoxy-L-arabinose transferase-like glycosyltransferase
MARIRIAEAANHGSPPQGDGASLPKGQTRFPTWKGAAVGSVLGLLLILCAHRFLTFVPQPFDSAGTLRPTLYVWFSRFVKRYASPEQAQQAWGTYCIVVLVIPVILAFWNYFNDRSADPLSIRLCKVFGSRPVFFTSIGLCLIVCRFPFLLADEINPDETFFIAAAEKLFKDLVFFRAVDFATSGPLNVYPVMLPALFGVSPDYVSTRLLALIIIFASIYVIYRVLAMLTDDATARIAILPAAGAFAVLKRGDFLHYSSEHVSFLLLALALYMCVKTFRRPKAHAWMVVGLGLLTAAAFLAKMQAVPIVGCVAAVTVAYAHAGGHAGRWWRPALLFGVGLAPLLLANAIVCAWAGVWHDFRMEYIVANYHYVESASTLTPEMQRFADSASGIPEIRLLVTSLLGVLAAYVYQKRRRASAGKQAAFLETAVAGGAVAVAANWLLLTAGGAVVSYAAMISMLILPGSFLLLYRRPGWELGPVKWFGFLTAAVLAAAATAAYLPHRQYRHYFLLLVLPLSIATAWPVVAASAGVEGAAGNEEEDVVERRHARAPFFLVFAALILACQVVELGSPDAVAFAAVPSSVRAPESDLIEALTLPQGRITVWGWNGRPYVGAGRISALKDFFSAQLFLDNPEVRRYYRKAYVSGLRRGPPELFIDAVENSRGPYDPRNRFEVIPEIGTFIQANYVHVLDAYKERFYIRRDLARSVAGIGDPRKCDAQAIRCFEAGAGAEIPADLPPVQMPEHSLVEATFTPEGKQDPYATVFSNEGSMTVHEGFQFVHMENDRYRLGVGWGPEGRLSEELVLPQRKPAYLAIEFNGNVVTVVCNGAKRFEMRLPKRMLDSPGPITIGSWMQHQRLFRGNIQFFQIRSLGQERRTVTADAR